MKYKVLEATTRYSLSELVEQAVNHEDYKLHGGLVVVSERGTPRRYFQAVIRED